MAEALRRVDAGSQPGDGAARAASGPVVTNDNGPVIEHVTLAVNDMHCGACIQSVEGTLCKLPGVVSARANLAARRVSIAHETDKLSIEELIGALTKAGHEAAELSATPDAEAAARDGDLLKRLGVAGFAAMNVMLLSVSVWAGAASGDMEDSVQSMFHWLSALIALPAIAYAGQPFFKSAAGALRGGRLNMDVPISLGVLLATAMSLFHTIRGTHNVYFDAAITLLAFLLIGRLLDQQMRTKAAGAAANLLGFRAYFASRVHDDDRVERISAKNLKPGMRVLAATGERIAADGIVREGVSDIDDSLLTGETAPKKVSEGTRVYAGTLNLTGPLVVEATATEEGSLIAEISRLMEAAEQNRGRYMRLADRAARIYAPAVHLLGLMTFIGWMLMGQGWEPALTKAIAVLIVTCPCALALAVPAVQVAASSRLFARGLILKAADGLERMSEIDTVVFDKTGTLTTGEPKLADTGLLPDDVLIRAASLAAASRHPYSRAIVAEATVRGQRVEPANNVREIPGCGLSRITQQGEERLGSAEWCGADKNESTGSICYRDAAGKVTAFHVVDTLRDDAAETIARLKAGGFSVEVLSGDRPQAVEAAAHEAGITDWRGGQHPDQKIARLDELKAAGRHVLMIGDGINDAPALATAHASLSPASAADISQTTADAILQGKSLAGVGDALAVAKSAHRLALQNFGIAIVYNAIFVPLAVAGLVTPLIAAIAMSASSITVTANAVRLKAMRLELKA
ncbi:MAG: heavy metal translocating P-type ATPase [Hyphomicrobiaceae bacterium]